MSLFGLICLFPTDFCLLPSTSKNLPVFVLGHGCSDQTGKPVQPKAHRERSAMYYYYHRITSHASNRCHQLQLHPSQSSIYLSLLLPSAYCLVCLLLKMSFLRRQESIFFVSFVLFVVKSSSIAYCLLPLPFFSLPLPINLPSIFHCQSSSVALTSKWPPGQLHLPGDRDKPQPDDD